MANRVKEVSAFDGTSWGAAVPLGADDSNVDITSSTTQPDGSAVSGVTGDSATALNTSAVTVSEGDTGASAWTKFNRFRKRVANNFANYIQGSIATSYNATGSDSVVYSTNVLNNYMANVIGYSGTTAPSTGTVAAQLSSLNDKLAKTTLTTYKEWSTSIQISAVRTGNIVHVSGWLFVSAGTYTSAKPILVITNSRPQPSDVFCFDDKGHALRLVDNNSRGELIFHEQVTISAETYLFVNFTYLPL